ncbi:MAG: MBOAT family protein, partial [Actinobacteria bacterium]|nr:MBOAT family protein [Actinomycetota bacterium]
TALALAIDVAVLGYFKYANFLVDQANLARSMFGMDALPWTTVLLPVGISFFTFQRMSYTVDVSRRVRPALGSPLDHLLYVALFPQLIAGPIVRYQDIDRQLRGERRVTLDDVGAGAIRFGHGLAKKVLVADVVAPIADAVFEAPGTPSTAAVWIAALAYAVQIYADFSGYSDMAIGLGRMFGFTFPENFRRPYSAMSITDFWRRWHITLSTWFRDYLYIPLGGGRGRPARTYANLAVVFLATGIWHGAAWTFVLWGAYHGGLLMLERATGQRATGDDEASVVWLRRAVVFALVVIGWVLFRARSMRQAASFITAMVVPSGAALPPALQAALTPRAATTLVLSLVVLVLLPRGFVGGLSLTRSPRRPVTAWRVATAFVLLPYAAIVAASTTFSPFLYFRF